jgi:DNA (cytosine-5)-methyltransferase 1
MSTKSEHDELPVAVDLFSGAGGLSEGLEMAGFRVASAVELHPQAALTHALNHPDCEIVASGVEQVDFLNLRATLRERYGVERPHLVAGGPPCQGFSTAGKKRAKDPRNELFKEFVRAVGALDPLLVLLENVPGFKKMHRGVAYEETRDLLQEIGYETDDRIVQAYEHGVPQRRQRFILIGWKPELIDAAQWPDPDFSYSASAEAPDPSLSPAVTIAEALADLAFLEPGWEAHRHSEKASSRYAGDRRSGTSLLFNHLATAHRPKAVEMFRKIPEGGTIASVDPDQRTAKVTMARMDRGKISNAVLALPDDLIHYEQDRIPTVREMARLQGFDDDYVFMGKRTSGFMERRIDVPQYTQVGNAVPPLLAAALGRSLLAMLDRPTGDVRALAARRERHALVCGSSGFSGYALSPDARGQVLLRGTDGKHLSLPIGEEKPVSEQESPREWRGGRSRSQKWAPEIPSPETATHSAAAAHG